MYNIADLTRIKDRIVDMSKATSRLEFGSLRKSIRGYVFPVAGLAFHELSYGGARGKGRPVGYKGKYRGSAVRENYGMNSLLEENVRKLVNTNPDIKWKIIREDPRSGKQWVISYDGNGKQPKGKGNLVDKTPKPVKSDEASNTAYRDRVKKGAADRYLEELRNRRNGNRKQVNARVNR
jgi:hypothetical protein